MGLYRTYSSKVIHLSLLIFGNYRTLDHTHSATMSAEQPEYWKPPFDARFPNMNQTRNCWQNYVDYFRCQKIKGEDYTPCEYFKKVYTHLCPNFWVEKWDDQRENGTFPGKI